jgi:hypothetical protein
MASNVNPASPHREGDGPSNRPGDRGQLALPEHTAFVNADSPHAGHEITRSLDEGYAVVLVSADGRERIITAKTLAASRWPPRRDLLVRRDLRAIPGNARGR